jgi:hypothetical protein
MGGRASYDKPSLDNPAASVLEDSPPEPLTAIATASQLNLPRKCIPGLTNPIDIVVNGGDARTYRQDFRSGTPAACLDTRSRLCSPYLRRRYMTSLAIPLFLLSDSQRSPHRALKPFQSKGEKMTEHAGLSSFRFLTSFEVISSVWGKAVWFIACSLTRFLPKH